MEKEIWKMNTIRLDDFTQSVEPCVATIGFFDGVHKGHQFLIRHVIEEAKISGLQSTVITFDEHPRQVLQDGYMPEMLSTLDSKLLLLSKTGVDNTVVLHFNKEMAELSARDFMEQILRDRLHVKKLVIGYDNRFGHDRREGFEDYVRFGEELGIEVIRNEAFMLNGVNVSSSVVRAFLKEGEIEMANSCLGYPYTIVGKVVKGYQKGRKMGFPTANLDASEFGMLVPAPGVYAVKTRLEGSVAMKQGMMNIGTRPTFDGNNISLETNIFDFSGDIYGKLMLVSFEHRIRSERKFDGPEQLKEQLIIDKQIVKEQFKKDNDD